MRTSTLLPIGAVVRLRVGTLGLPGEWCQRPATVVAMYDLPITQLEYGVEIEDVPGEWRVWPWDVEEVVNAEVKHAA